MKKSLPLIDADVAVGRRQVLLTGVAAAALAACGPATSDPSFPGDAGPSDNGTGTGTDTGGAPPDARTMPRDSGTTPVDTGIDVGTMPRDSGTTPRDTGTTPVDTGTTPADTGIDVGPTCSPGPSMAGMLSDFPPNTWTYNRANRVIIGHDAGGLFAFSSVCTHDGCTINVTRTTGQSVCPCHFSTFDSNGTLTRGPARTSLSHYGVSVCNGIVYVNRAMTVAPTMRTSV